MSGNLSLRRSITAQIASEIASRANHLLSEGITNHGACSVLVRANDKKAARLNCISHLLSLIPYKKVKRDKVRLPKRSNKYKYDDQATLKGRRFVPEQY